MNLDLIKTATWRTWWAADIRSHPVTSQFFDVAVSALCVLVVVGTLAATRRLASGQKSWNRLGRSPGPFGLYRKMASQEFERNGRALVRDGYSKHNLKGQNFVIQTVSKEQLVIAPRFLPEIRSLPESKLSHAKLLLDHWVGEHIGADLAMDGAQHIDAVRGLTRSLKSLVPIMHREYRRTSEALFAHVPKSTNQMNAYNFCFATVQSITSTALIGEELTHSGGWAMIVMEYFPEATRITTALKPWPRALRALVKPFLVRGNKLEGILAKAELLLDEPIRKRRETDNQDVDILKLLAEYNETPRKVALQIVGIITAAVVASTHTLVQAIYNLCAHPEYISDIRAEALEALTSEGGQWTLGVIKKLHLLDSFIKESLRLLAPEGLAITRVATSSFSLSDGT